jgi:hypothetical protein
VDLSQVNLRDALGQEQFDVVVFGDVLEHLMDPLTTLRQARQLLVDLANQLGHHPDLYPPFAVGIIPSRSAGRSR